MAICGAVPSVATTCSTAALFAAEVNVCPWGAANTTRADAADPGACAPASGKRSASNSVVWIAEMPGIVKVDEYGFWSAFMPM